MTRELASARRWTRRAVASIVVTVVGGGAFAQSENKALNAEGLQAGGMIFVPSLTFGYSYDTNVLQEPEIAEPEPDQVLTLQPAVQLTIPFSNSSFSFGDVLTYVDYKHTPQIQGKTSNDAVADLTLNFGSLNQLEINAHNIAGVADTLAFDLGGEIAFQGNAYQLHTEAVSLSRLLPGTRGYRFGLQRSAVRFDPTITAVSAFYNYRGFEGEASYFQPLSPNTRLAFGYLGSRYEHSDVGNPDVVQRTENGDVLYGQIEGQLGPRQPYIVRLGWQRLGFTDSEGGSLSGDFAGIVGDLKLSAIVGGGTMFTVGIQRSPYRSYESANSFYVFNLISGSVERLFLSGTSVGGSLGLSVNGYKQPTTYTLLPAPDPPDPPETVTIFREDRRVQLEAHANIAVAKRLAFRVSLARNRRYSNAPEGLFDYNNTVLFGGFVLGWI